MFAFTFRNLFGLLSIAGLLFLPGLFASAQAFQQENAVAQELLTFKVQVVDADGVPVERAVIRPWANRSSQGHGSFSGIDDGGFKPTEVVTNSVGIATVTYPKYSHIEEEIRVMAVTLSIDHLNHPYVSHSDVVVPSRDTTTIQLPRGSAIEVSVSLNGEKVTDNSLKAFWSGWNGKSRPKLTDDQAWRIPPIREGLAQFMFIKIGKDGTATHFSPLEKVDIDGSAPVVS